MGCSSNVIYYKGPTGPQGPTGPTPLTSQIETYYNSTAGFTFSVNETLPMETTGYAFGMTMVAPGKIQIGRSGKYVVSFSVCSGTTGNTETLGTVGLYIDDKLAIAFCNTNGPNGLPDYALPPSYTKSGYFLLYLNRGYIIELRPTVESLTLNDYQGLSAYNPIKMTVFSLYYFR